MQRWLMALSFLILVSCNWGKKGTPLSSSPGDDTQAPAIGEAPVRPSGELQNFTTLAETLPQPLEHGASLVIGNRLYIFGGQINNGVTDEVTDQILYTTISEDGSITDFEIDTHKLDVARKAHRAERIGNFVYLFGGMVEAGASVSNSPLNSIERAPCNNRDGITGDFEVIPQTLDVGRLNLLTLVTPGFVYAIGGGIDALDFETDTISRATVDTTTGELTSNFTPLTRTVVGADEVTDGLVEPRWTHAGLRLGNNFYVIGGEGSNTIERTVIQSDGTLSNFVKVPEVLASNRNRVVAFALADKVHVAAGWSAGFLTTVESSDITNDEIDNFSVIPGITLPTGVENTIPLLTNQGIFLFGGFNGTTRDIIQFAPIN